MAGITGESVSTSPVYRERAAAGLRRLSPHSEAPGRPLSRGVAVVSHRLDSRLAAGDAGPVGHKLVLDLLFPATVAEAHHDRHRDTVREGEHQQYHAQLDHEVPYRHAGGHVEHRDQR